MPMLHYYSYEYSWADPDQSVSVYRSRDGAIGLRVRTPCHNGIPSDGYSRFFLWNDESASPEFDSELQARLYLEMSGRQQDIHALALRTACPLKLAARAGAPERALSRAYR